MRGDGYWNPFQYTHSSITSLCKCIRYHCYNNKGNNKITEQSNKGKVKTHKYINRQNQSTTENCENRNDPDLVQVFLKKWWVESDFKAPILPLSLRLKVSGCHYNSIYNNAWTKQVKQLSKQNQTQWNKCQKHFYVTHWQKKYFWHFCWHLIFIHFHYMKIHRL